MLAAILPLLTLGGCQDDLPITVEADGQGVIFSVPLSKPPCVDRVTAYDARDMANPIWLIDSTDRTRCVIRFRYGEVPPGFTARGPTAKLVRGNTYIVALGGPGATGSARFQLTPAGAVVQTLD